MSEQKNQLVDLMGVWVKGVLVWDFKWRRCLLVWEEEFVVRLFIYAEIKVKIVQED